MELAFVGSDFLAVDWVAARIMGFDPEKIGYLHYCKEARLGSANPKIIGNVSMKWLKESSSRIQHMKSSWDGKIDKKELNL